MANKIIIKSKKRQKEYQEFMNKQFEILKGHCERTMLRCFNKLTELSNEENGKKTKTKKLLH